MRGMRQARDHDRLVRTHPAGRHGRTRALGGSGLPAAGPGGDEDRRWPHGLRATDRAHRQTGTAPHRAALVRVQETPSLDLLRQLSEPFAATERAILLGQVLVDTKVVDPATAAYRMVKALGLPVGSSAA